MSLPPRLVMVLVVDGRRPDAITADETPTLWRLRSEGVAFTDSHSVFPTVTRVNAATLVTGAQPATHGIVGNEMYVPAVEPSRAFSTQDYRRLVRLDEASGRRLLHAPARAPVRSADRGTARRLATLEPLGLAGATDVVVVSDHGFTTNTAGVDVVGELVAAGLKASRESDDVVLASSGQAVGLHVRERD